VVIDDVNESGHGGPEIIVGIRVGLRIGVEIEGSEGVEQAEYLLDGEQKHDQDHDQ
jgi:hypothetical protein